MNKCFAGGHLRYVDGAWRDDNGYAVDIEPVRHGEWKPVDGIDPCDEWGCTACEERMTFMYELEADDMKVDFRYCPNCGAKMNGKEDKK